MSIFPSCTECSKGAKRQHYGNSLLHEMVEIPKNEAIEIVTKFSIEPIIAKTRYEVP